MLVLTTPEAFILMVCTVKVHAWGKLCSHIKRIARLLGVVGVYTGLFLMMHRLMCDLGVNWRDSAV